jgi:hypothetical protein
MADNPRKTAASGKKPDSPGKPRPSADPVSDIPCSPSFYHPDKIRPNQSCGFAVANINSTEPSQNSQSCPVTFVSH